MIPSEYYNRYSPGVYSNSSSGYSSGVSTPAMTPPPGYMLEAMMTNQPCWAAKPGPDMIMHQIIQLQQQTNQLIHSLQRPPHFYPTTHQLGFQKEPNFTQIAQSVLSSCPSLDEQTIARAVVVVANAMVANRAGVRSSYNTPPVITPTAVRSATPAWLASAAEGDMFSINSQGQVIVSPTKSLSPKPTPGFGLKLKRTDEEEECIYN